MRQKNKEKGIILDNPKGYERLMHFLLRDREGLMRDCTVDYANLQPKDNVLDIGCGTGTLTIAAKKRLGEDGTVIGMDPSPQMVEYAQSKANQQGISVQFKQGFIQELPFEDNSFDKVFCSLVIHHVPKALQLKGFQEIYRILKPGGQIIIMEFKPPTSRFWRFIGFFIVGHMVFLKVEKFQNLLGDCGFINIQTHKTPWDVLILMKGEKSN